MLVYCLAVVVLFTVTPCDRSLVGVTDVMDDTVERSGSSLNSNEVDLTEIAADIVPVSGLLTVS